uniref:hypothetical protein n=1 Tax=Pseudoclavibacter sp. RFBI5 TaxID=2080578 RepID=UPI0011AFDD68|nr:hypothetical protein [Pseudoclavibacter sp. RFBI5]
MLSTTIKSFVPVFSRRLADRLSYGLTSALDLAANVAGKSIDEVLSPERAVQTFMLLRSPPERYVSYHYEATEIRDSLTVEALSTLPFDGAVAVWLRESRQLLQHAVLHRSETDQSSIAHDLDEALSHRAAVDEEIENLGERAIVVKVDLPPDVDPTISPSTIRDSRVVAALEAADVVADQLFASGLCTRLEENVYPPVVTRN